MKNKIIRNARKMFAENGYEGTSVSEITNSLNTSKSALYNHFKSKKDLYMFIFAYDLEHWYAVIEKSLQRIGDWDEKSVLRQLLLDTTHYFLENRYEIDFLTRAMFFSSKKQREMINQNAEILAQNKKFYNAFYRLAQNGIEHKVFKDIGAVELTNCFYNTIQILFVNSNIYVEKHEEKSFNLRFDMLVNGIAFR